MSEPTTTVRAYNPFTESNPRAGAEQLRAAMQDHGYLFFRALVPPEEVLAVRNDVLELCRAAGWLDQSHDLMQDVVNPDMQPTTEGKPEYDVTGSQRFGVLLTL
jgi:hypothetical protein